jgi:hypothetical protein
MRSIEHLPTGTPSARSLRSRHASAPVPVIADVNDAYIEGNQDAKTMGSWAAQVSWTKPPLGLKSMPCKTDPDDVLQKQNSQ